MKLIDELRTLLEGEIKRITLPSNPENLYLPIKYVLNIGGKRTRPILTLMAHQLFDSDINKSLKPAIAIEMFHNFTLLHDDIMDEAPLRRGMKTVHEKWDNNIAILSGDSMLVHSYNLLMKVDDCYLRSILESFNRAAAQVCEGQQLDMDFEQRDDVSISEYLSMIEYKTSVLLATALKIGAINGGANTDEVNHIYEFGRNLGIAFQLKDDLLDAFGDPGSFGKQVGGDIIANKKTYLYIKAMELADEIQKKQLNHYYSNNIDLNVKVDSVKNIFLNLNIPTHTTNLMMDFHRKALTHLDSIKSKNKQPLYSFSMLLLDRVS
tara:strand:+ start:76 stop:1041 length:966 start_codon:yes stop_codon:yes gene_type:complete